MGKVFVDGVELELDDNVTLLEGLLAKGADLPYFCWHPSMGSIGACRQCAVIQYRDENDDRGRIVMSCMTPVTQGARFSLTGPAARAFRTSVVENLMINHPHDCPVCEEGGECHLQDMTVMTGHRDRVYTGLKTTFNNQYLGPLIGHEMNRCITCYRCVRFYQDYAGGHDLAAFASRDHVFFGRAQDGVLENEFAGNLVEVCPTGVFTDKVLSAKYTRKWDLQTAPSICPGCSLGCNITPAERYGELRRVHNRYNNEINGYFLCDRGRYGAHFVNSPNRIRYCGVRSGEVYEALPPNTLLDIIATAIRQPGRLVGIGSPRASLESNFALQQLVGVEAFYSGLDQRAELINNLMLEILENTAADLPSMRETEDYDAVLILGEDLTNHAPRLALSIRQAARNRSFELAAEAQIPSWHDAAVRKIGQQDRSPIFIATPAPDRLDDVASLTIRETPDEIARLGFEIATALRTGQADSKQISAICDALTHARRPLIVSGSSLGNAQILKAAASIADALAGLNADTGLMLCPDEFNSIGMAMLPHNESGLEQLLAAGAVETAIVIENDLSRRLTDEQFRQLRTSVSNLIVIDHLENATASASTHVLPAATLVESTGTVVNNEGRAQRFFEVYVPGDAIAPTWQWLARLGQLAGRDGFEELVHIDQVTDACAQAWPKLAGIVRAAPQADFRIRGSKIPRLGHRASGRTAMLANVSVHEPMQPADAESALAFTMEGRTSDVPPALQPQRWSPGWNSNQAVSKFQQEIGGAMKGGDVGIRLIAGRAKGCEAWQFEVIDSELVPIARRHHIFGSEELSGESKPIAQLAPAASCTIHPNLAESLGVTSGDGVQYVVDGKTFSLAVAVSDAVADGCAVISFGLTDTRHLNTIDAISLARADDWQPVQVIASDREA